MRVTKSVFSVESLQFLGRKLKPAAKRRQCSGVQFREPVDIHHLNLKFMGSILMIKTDVKMLDTQPFQNS